MTKIIQLLFLALLVGNCQSTTLEMGTAAAYLPPPTLFEKGVAYKYYEQEYPSDQNKTNSTNIGYRSYDLRSATSYIEHKYSAAMQRTGHYEYQFEGDKMNVLTASRIFGVDTVQAEIIHPTSLNWNIDDAKYAHNYTLSNGYQRFFETEQVAHADTIIENLACRKFHLKGNLRIISPEMDTINYPMQEYLFFAKGIGLLQRNSTYEEVNYQRELIEQMPLAEFEKRIKEVPHRKAYIDPSQTLDNNSNFKICNSEAEIGDYYNCKFRGQLRGSKGSWWRIIEQEVDEEQLNSESGYLTFRFVLNCQGEAGRFITEQADLNFNKKEFNATAVNHLYEIVSKQTDWQACQNEEKGKDSYVYITFKLKDGKIIELLP